MSFHIDLRLLRLSIKQLLNDSSEEYSDDASTVPNDAHSAQSSIPSDVPCNDFLLLIFIRYVQLLQLIPWSSPVPICNGPMETPNHNRTDSLPRITHASKKRKEKPGLCGLANIGNTCFMNSAIQCLSNIPQLTEWAKNQQSNHQKNVTKAYSALIKSMWSGENSYVRPSDIKKRVSQHAPIFSDYAQKDSHEFMNSLLNALHSELGENNSSEEQSSIVTELFRIPTESGVTCLTCSTYDPIEETTYCLPLPLGDEPEVPLQTLLRDFLKEELLEGQYYCSKCEDLQSAKQKTSLGSPLPPVIIVQLKRFTFDETNDKINTLVTYPIENWSIDDNNSAVYDLAAVSMHVGNLKGGHYTTFARLNGSGEWYHFNDSSVEPVNDNACLVNRNAYVLVYLKKN
jgi:ubiquitin carboxyl-terminal hydrolase 8